MLELLTLFAIVLGVNLIPAFGPPTWAVLVLYVLNSDIHPGLLIPVAATAAAAYLTKKWADRLKMDWQPPPKPQPRTTVIGPDVFNGEQ